MSITMPPGPGECDTMGSAVPYGTVGVWHTQSELHDLSCLGAVCSYPLGKPIPSELLAAPSALDAVGGGHFKSPKVSGFVSWWQLDALFSSANRA